MIRLLKVSAARIGDTIHHSYGVPGTNRRRAFSLRFLGDGLRQSVLESAPPSRAHVIVTPQ